MLSDGVSGKESVADQFHWLIQPSLFISSATLAGCWPSLLLRNICRCLSPVKDDLPINILGVCCIVWKCTIMYVGQTGNSIQTSIRGLHWHVCPYHSVKSSIAEQALAWVMVSCYRTPLSWPESQYTWTGSLWKQQFNHNNNNGEGVCPWAGYEHLLFTPWRNTRRLFRGVKHWFGFFWECFLKITVTYPVPVTVCFFSTFHCTSF